MLIYTHPLLLNVVNVQNLLKIQQIETIIRNEFSAGATGDLAPNETWVELWLSDEQDLARAQSYIAEHIQQQRSEWHCAQCGESNDGSFELCWQCQTERDDP